MARYQWIMTAHYDGQSDWYDEFNAPHAAATRPYVIELMGPGDGACLDLGSYLDAIRATGRTINAFIDAGLTIERVYEPYEQPIPNILAVRAVRHQGA
jgi:hypothetical protein